MPRKKIIFVIVEGLSDQTALGAVMSKIFDDDRVFIHIMHCDITTKHGVNVGNIKSKICDEVRQYTKQNHFKKTDFKEIVHIVDMDGAYISNQYIIENQVAEKPIYQDKEILTCHKEKMEARNRQKSANLNKLCGCQEIWGIPYRIFYMSCNLDHVLYHKQNSTEAEKEKDSHAFAQTYKNNPSAFLRFITQSDFSVMTGYEESWKYIRTKFHSLERHSNLGLCFDHDLSVSLNDEIHHEKEKILV